MFNGVPSLDLQQLPPNIYITRGRCVPRTICLPETCPPVMHRPAPWSVEDFHLHVQLYKGKASILYSATCRYSKLPVALKLYRKDKLSHLNWYQVEREIRLHSQLRHENIIELYGAFEDAENVYLVQEYAEDGDLYEDLKRHKGRMEETRVAARIVYPCMLALSYLHSKGVIHRDIKAENILLKADGTIKLADFGLSINYLEERPVTRAGTLDMMAPEVLVCPEKNRPDENKEKAMLEYTAAVDSWAMGIVAFELLVGHPPFEKQSKQETYEHIMYRAPVLPSTLSDQAKSFVVSSLVKAVSRRPSVSELLQHPWCQLHLSKLAADSEARRRSKLEQAPAISINADCTLAPASQVVSRTASSDQSSNSVELLERGNSSSLEASKASMFQWANSSFKSITKKLRSKPLIPLQADPVPQPPPLQKNSAKKYRPLGRSANQKAETPPSEGSEEQAKELHGAMEAQARLEQKLAERPIAMPLPTLLIPESLPQFSQPKVPIAESHAQNDCSFSPFGQYNDVEPSECPEDTEEVQEPVSPPGEIQAFYPPPEQDLAAVPPVRVRQPRPAPKPIVRSLEGLLLDDDTAESRPSTYRRVLRNTPAGLEADPESPPAYLARPWLSQRSSKVNADSPPLSPRGPPGSPLMRRRRRIAGKMDSSASGSLVMAETPKGFPSGHNSARSFKQIPKSNPQNPIMGGTMSRFGVTSAHPLHSPMSSAKSSGLRYNDANADIMEAAMRRAQSAVPGGLPVARKLSLNALDRES